MYKLLTEFGIFVTKWQKINHHKIFDAHEEDSWFYSFFFRHVHESQTKSKIIHEIIWTQIFIAKSANTTTTKISIHTIRKWFAWNTQSKCEIIFNLITKCVYVCVLNNIFKCSYICKMIVMNVWEWNWLQYVIELLDHSLFGMIWCNYLCFLYNSYEINRINFVKTLYAGTLDEQFCVSYLKMTNGVIQSIGWSTLDFFSGVKKLNLFQKCIINVINCNGMECSESLSQWHLHGGISIWIVLLLFCKNKIKVICGLWRLQLWISRFDSQTFVLFNEKLDLFMKENNQITLMIVCVCNWRISMYSNIHTVNYIV